MNIQIGQAQLIVFTLVNSSGVLVTGLDDDFIVQISKNGGTFAASAGTKDEIEYGWYSYGLTAAETDTEGPLAIKVTGTGAVQKNLLHNVVGYAPAIPTGTNILTTAEAATVLRGETDDPDMLDLLPIVDAFIKNHTGRDWTLDTTIHPMAKAAARLILVEWHEDAGMSAGEQRTITLGARNLLFELKMLAKSELISGVPDEELKIEQTNIGAEMAIDASILLVFNHEMANSATGDVSIEDGNGNSVAATNSLDVTKKIMTLNPSSNLSKAMTYTVIIDHAEDIYGQALDDEITFYTEEA
jgi:hypothetical protein